MLIAVTIALSVVVGLAVGLLGGGGTILLLPLLVYVAGLETKEAIATSLLVVGVTSVFATATHARAGNVHWRTGAVFGAAGMVGAYIGGLLSRFIPGWVLMLAFAAMMIATATAMLRTRGAAEDGGLPGPLPLVRIVVDGLTVGLVTGIVGAGGGFLVVPALALLGGLPMVAAVGTSVLVIAMKSFAGLAGYLSTVSIDWALAAGISVTAVIGAVIGGRLADKADPELLRRIFGWFVLVMATVILAQELSLWAGGAALAATAAYAVVTVIRARGADDPAPGFLPEAEGSDAATAAAPADTADDPATTAASSGPADPPRPVR